MSTFMRKVNMLSRCEGNYRTEKLGVSELAACHHSYVLAISNNPGLSQEQLVRHMCINKSNVTRHLAYLEKQGYVRRECSQADRRVMLVYPTQKMLDILPEVRRITMEWNRYLAADLTEAEFAQFQSILERLVERATAYMEGEVQAE